jgi:hypothetical protein
MDLKSWEHYTQNYTNVTKKTSIPRQINALPRFLGITALHAFGVSLTMTEDDTFRKYSTTTSCLALLFCSFL